MIKIFTATVSRSDDRQHQINNVIHKATVAGKRGAKRRGCGRQTGVGVHRVFADESPQ